MKRLFLIGALVTLIAGALTIVLALTVTEFDDWIMVYSITGAVIALLGILMLVTGYTTPVVAQSKEGFMAGVLLIIGSVIAVIGPFLTDFVGPAITLGGAVLVLFGMLAWSCFCCQGSGKARRKILGIASAHERISVSEIAKIAQIEESIVRDTIYDALGKREIHGRMEGTVFIRTAPSSTAYVGRPAGDAKVLVICPYCGAKTEQGLTKCQNCQADL
ncbi:MAG: hypothetical protein EAX95_04585 [Candidatus Thorarchaeota archaeon]|nr:hypothetical protein [Candidatus Thorarchaeota archaeon]